MIVCQISCLDLHLEGREDAPSFYVDLHKGDNSICTVIKTDEREDCAT